MKSGVEHDICWHGNLLHLMAQLRIVTSAFMVLTYSGLCAGCGMYIAWHGASTFCFLMPRSWVDP